MDSKLLLDALRGECVLLEARARGAKEAYKMEAVRQASSEFAPWRDQLVVIKFSTRDVKAELTDLIYASWQFEGYEGPAFVGRQYLKSGKLSKSVVPLFTADMWRQKQVVRVA